MGMSSNSKKIISKDGFEEMDIKRAVSIDDKHCITRSHVKDERGPEMQVLSKNYTPKNNKNSKLCKNLAEVFRTDFITAMKVPDSQMLPSDECLTLKDTWRQEWEKGVQVPVNPDKVPNPVLRSSGIKPLQNSENLFKLPSELLKFSEEKFNEELKQSTVSCNYDLDDVDMEWLKSVSDLRTVKKANTIDALTMERALTWFERECFSKMAHAVATKEGLSIEYDESTTCNVCLSPDAEDGNEIIFCDACNMCVHQHCYGVLEIPEGNWLCNPCSRGVLSPPCCLCPSKGGAMKRIKDSYEWVHVICAWWVPEVKIEDVKFIERIRTDKIPASRWNLVCSICREKGGASIQCSVKRCVKAYHVTCAVKDGLEMKTVVVPEKDDVQHISFCSKHCTPVPHDLNPHRSKSGEEIENNRLKELRKLESEFYDLVSVSKAESELKLPKEVTRRLLSYWTMKRRRNDNSPLIPLTLEQQEKLSGKQGVVLLNQQKTLEMERFLHLRQDLERLRNLCYMIVRREKVRKELQRTSMEIFYKQNDILLEEGDQLTDSALDLLRHRTTLFNNFTDTYTTEKVWKEKNGITGSVYDTTLEEENELLNSSQFEILKEKDLERELKEDKVEKNRSKVKDEINLCEVEEFEIRSEQGRTSSPNRNSITKGITQRNIFDFFKKQEVPIVLDSIKSETKDTNTSVVIVEDRKNEILAKKKLEFGDIGIVKPINNDVVVDTGPRINEENDKEAHLMNKIYDLDKNKLSNGTTSTEGHTEKIPLPSNLVDKADMEENVFDSCDNVFKTSSLVRKGKKRFRNLNLINEHQQQRRNSPRLKKITVDEPQSDPLCHREEDVILENGDSKMNFFANGHKKRRRLNSCGDFIGENGEEQSNYIRMTRSRVSSCT